MKKFILVATLAVAPSLAVADTLGCAGGALLLGAIGAQIGGGVVPKILATTGAFAGCSAGSRIEDGTYGVQQAPIVTRTVTLVNSGAPLSSYSSPCPGHWEGSYFMEEGTQRSWRSGGITRDGCGGGGQRVVNASPAVYKIEETRQAAPQKYTGPTIDNYLDSPYIHPDCKTENPEVDGYCLLGKVQGLMIEQAACVCTMLSPGDPEYSKRQCRRVKEVGAYCPKRSDKFNAGTLAYYYKHLAEELLAAQEAQQGGMKIEK